jgi:tetratricopeptide (TPR) repeat protein
VNPIELQLQAAARFYEAGEVGEAARLFWEVLAAHPHNPAAWERLGICHYQLGHDEDAVESYRRAIQIDPRLPSPLNNLGNALLRLGHRDEALACFDRAIELQPNFSIAYKNKSMTHWSVGNIEAALQTHEELACHTPDDADVRSQIGVMRLLLGDFAGGWPEYEWRWKTSQLRLPALEKPLWDGHSLDGRTILLWPEQGLGDFVQFIRYAAWLKDRHACHVLVHGPKKLEPLLAHCEGVDDWIDDLSNAPVYDCYAPLLHVPGILRQRSSDFPNKVPYLSADSSLVELWRDKLTNFRGHKIGIAWRGSPTHEADSRRSIPLPAFKHLARIPTIQLFSLQKGPGSEEADNAPEIVDIGRQLDETTGAFVETAAVLKNLDLLITCDTAIAHVAGALGMPVWVALCHVPDWRWGLTGNTTVWYPTMRLFRQPTPGDWTSVFSKIAAAITSRRE